jgi:hypothetical protein
VRDPEDATGGIRSLLRAILSEDSSKPSTWPILAERLRDLDQLTTFEQMVLPMLVERWQAQGQRLDELPLLRGLRRKMLVRNRLLLTGAQAALERFCSAGIDAIPLKWVALVGRGLPAAGLRAIADIDLWVRPSQFDQASAVYATRAIDPLRDVHATTTVDASGRELDLHQVPSHLFSLRPRSAQGAAKLFERTWRRRVGNQPARADVIYFSFLNPLFFHAPGDSRAAFALIELDVVLRHTEVSDRTLQLVVANAVEDKTVAIFVEHLHWLGTGASATLDRFLREWLEPALTSNDRAMLHWIGALQHLPGFDPAYRHELRGLTYAQSAIPRSSWMVARSLAATHTKAVWSKPWLLATWLVRRRSWRRLQQLMQGLFSVHNPTRAQINDTSPPAPPAPRGRTPPP